MDATALQRLTHRIASDRRVDGAVARMDRLADRLQSDPRVRRAVRGEWLGHPAHPMLTDLPVGFWTSAFLLDLGGRRTARAADVMVAAGVVSALPTMATGLADWSTRTREEKRIGAVHAGANLAATTLYAASLGHRMKGHRVRGVVFGLVGAAAASAGGYLGGHLAFGADEPDVVDVRTPQTAADSVSHAAAS